MKKKEIEKNRKLKISPCDLASVYPAFRSMVAGISQEIVFFLGVIYTSFERKSHTIQSTL